jgi:hypothetical protein
MYKRDAFCARGSESADCLYGRPNREALAQQAIISVDNDKRALIVACGPTGLLHTVRNITADYGRVNHGWLHQTVSTVPRMLSPEVSSNAKLQAGMV